MMVRCYARLYATLGNDVINLVTSTMCNQSGKCLADLIVKQTVREKSKINKFNLRVLDLDLDVYGL
jgi:hypothetical protein